jgi:hypothetical protein
MIQDAQISIADYGADPTGVADSTAAIQNAFNASTNIYIPSGIYKIKAHTDTGGFGGVEPQSNSRIEFAPGAVFQAITNDKGAYSIIKALSKENITFINPTLIGDKDTHTGTTGEFGMGFLIRNSNEIHIDGGNISKCWGDGIYIGQVSDVGYCENISLRNLVVNDCRRQGMSVISVDGLLIENCEFSDTNGIPPSAGIDFEPNLTNGRLSRISLINVKTANNDGGGVLIDLLNYTSDPTIANNISITSINHQDEGSVNGLIITRCLNTSSGAIRFVNSVYRNSDKQAINIRRWSSLGAKIELIDPTIINPNRDGEVSIGNGAAITSYTLSADATPTIASGNVLIDSPRFIFETGFTSPVVPQISFRDTKTNTINNVQLLNLYDDPATIVDSSSYFDFEERTCVVKTIGNEFYFGDILFGGDVASGNILLSSGNVTPVGTTARCGISFNPNSLWRTAIVRVAAYCCEGTTGSPAANTIGGLESIYFVRCRTGQTTVEISNTPIVTSANISIATTYTAGANDMIITATVQSGTPVSFDVQAGGFAGPPRVMSYT